GAPFVDLAQFIDTAELPALDDEITAAFAKIEPSYTGATLKRMGVVAPWQIDDGFVDAMDAIETMSDAELARFLALGDATRQLDVPDRARFAFGDEPDHPFSREQTLFLEYRHKVYFPWKVCVHLLENDRWEDKHSGEGKDYTAEARQHFPRT